MNNTPRNPILADLIGAKPEELDAKLTALGSPDLHLAIKAACVEITNLQKSHMMATTSLKEANSQLATVNRQRDQLDGLLGEKHTRILELEGQLEAQCRENDRLMQQRTTLQAQKTPTPFGHQVGALVLAVIVIIAFVLGTNDRNVATNWDIEGVKNELATKVAGMEQTPTDLSPVLTELKKLGEVADAKTEAEIASAKAEVEKLRTALGNAVEAFEGAKAKAVTPAHEKALAIISDLREGIELEFEGGATTYEFKIEDDDSATLSEKK